jgi:DALR domain
MTPVLLTLSRTTAAAASSSTSSSSSISKSKVQEDAVVFTSAVTSALSQFETGMDDDLNGPRAAAGLFALIKLGEKVRSNGVFQLIALVFTTATEEYLLSFLGFTFAYINHSIGYVYYKTMYDKYYLLY